MPLAINDRRQEIMPGTTAPRICPPPPRGSGGPASSVVPNSLHRFLAVPLLLLLLLLLIPTPSHGAVHDLAVTVSGDDALRIEALQSVVRRDGPVARVIVDAVFRSPSIEQGGSQLEGTFKLELPEGAAPFAIAFGPENEEEAKEAGEESNGGGAGSRYFVEYSLDDDLTSSSLVEARNSPPVSSSVKAGRMAPKSLASRSYTETVTRGVDPAIVESEGGAFSTRIFPIFGGERLHRVTFGYDVPLVHDEDGLWHELRVPAAAKTAGGGGDGDEGAEEEKSQASSPSVRAEVLSTGKATLFGSDGGSPVDDAVIISSDVGDTNDTVIRFDDPSERTHRIAFPLPVPSAVVDDTNATTFLPSLEYSPLAVGVAGGVYHYTASVRIPDDDFPSDAATISASRALFAVESSFAVARDVGAMELCGKILSAALTSDPDIEWFNVMVFDIGVQWLSPGGWISNDEEGRASAAEFLSKVRLEGATNLHLAVSEIVDPTFQNVDQGDDDQSDYDAFLLASGQTTWGETDPNRIVALLPPNDGRPPGRLHTYHVGSGGDSAVLRRLARTTGGTFTGDVLGKSDASASDLTEYLSPRLAVTSIAVDGAEGEVVVAGGSPRTVRPGQSLSVAWRASAPPADPEGDAPAPSPPVLRIGIVAGGGSTDPMELTANFDTVPFRTTDLAVRAYGVLSNSLLEERLPLSQDAARAIALYYRIVGRTASLVMLDTEEDYETYGIVESHSFDTVRDVDAAKIARELEEESAANARSPKAALMDFLDAVETGLGKPLNFPNATQDVLAKMTDDGLDVASAKKSSAYDRTDDAGGDDSRAVYASTGEGGVPEASYDEWTALSEERKERGSAFGALRAASSLLAQSPADHVLRRDVALSASDLGYPAAAYHALKSVATTRPWEPASYVSMANAARDAGLPDLAVIMYELCLAGEWDDRFVSFREVAGMLYARHLRSMRDDDGDGGSAAAAAASGEFAREREGQVRAWHGAEERAGIVAVMTWNQDRTDVDLHVVEPSGEECSFNNLETKSGGRLSGDVTQGYGPEMYVQPNLAFGTYRIDVNVFGTNPNRLSAPIKVLVEVFTNWGYSNEDYRTFTTVGRNANERVTVATIVLSASGDQTELPITSDKPQPGENGAGEVFNLGPSGDNPLLSDTYEGVASESDMAARTRSSGPSSAPSIVLFATTLSFYLLLCLLLFL